MGLRKWPASSIWARIDPSALRVLGPSPEVYEADVDVVMRLCIDAGIVPESCIIVEPARTAQPVAWATVNDKTRAASTVVPEVRIACDWRAVRSAPEAAWQNAVPPQVCMSLDCEMLLGPAGAFPQPSTEPVLQICCVVYDPIADPACQRVVRRAFVLGADGVTAVDAHAATWRDADEVWCFADERALLMAWALWHAHVQPDVLTGWNVEGFDLWYLLERASHLGLTAFAASFCRLPGVEARAVTREFTSGAHGTHVFKEVRGEGMWVWDLVQAFKRNSGYKFRSYGLG